MTKTFIWKLDKLAFMKISSGPNPDSKHLEADQDILETFETKGTDQDLRKYL